MRRVWIVALAVAAAVMGIGGATVSTAFACSCVSVTDAEAAADATAVFTGTLTEVRPPTVLFSSADPSRFVFTVDRVYKGKVFGRQSIVSASDTISCGLAVRVGQRAVIFAGGRRAGGAAESGEYGAGFCGGTRTLADGGPVPAAFDPSQQPLVGASPIGEDGPIPSVFVRNWYWFAGGAAGVLVVIVVAIPRRMYAPMR